MAKKIFQIGSVEVRVRSAPGLSGSTVKYLPVGQQVEADAGSRTEADGYVWWRHAEGWSAERSADGSEVFMVAIEPGKTFDAQKTFHVGSVPVRVRSAPALSGTSVKFLDPGHTLLVNAKSRTEQDGYVWWEHAEGWSAERTLDGGEVFLLEPGQAAPAPAPVAAKPPQPQPTPPEAKPRETAPPPPSSHSYVGGTAIQYDKDNPVRPAPKHADKNLKLRGYSPNTDPNLQRELVNYGSDDPTQPPQFGTLFQPHRVPPLSNFYRVHGWNWAPSPEPGVRGEPATHWPVTGLGLQTTPGEALHVPVCGYEIGGGFNAIVIYADEDTIALHYAREDTAARGYTVHVSNIHTDPNLLKLYKQLDDPNGPRYKYPNTQYDLPTLSAGQPFGTARGAEIVVAIVDTGTFMDPRSCDEWWQIRPGYTGACPRAR